MATARRQATARDYGPRTSTLLANQAFKFERLLEERDNVIFELRAQLWRSKRETRAALRALEGKQADEKESNWLEGDE